MKDDEKYICINNGNRKCLKYEKGMFILEIIKVILTPRMILAIGFVITMVMSAKGG
jgi:hypothetical protein